MRRAIFEPKDSYDIIKSVLFWLFDRWLKIAMRGEVFRPIIYHNTVIYTTHCVFFEQEVIHVQVPTGKWFQSGIHFDTYHNFRSPHE
jgi:hypothetical protein